MQITSEQTTAKLRLFPRNMDEMSDAEIEQFLNDVIRPERGKAVKKKSPTPTKAKTSKHEVDVDDLA